MTLTAKDVGEIARLLQESSFDELTLELDGLKLTLRRNGAAPPETPGPGAPITLVAQPRSSEMPPGEGPRVDAAAAADATTRAQPEGGTVRVAAPLLGTFYRSPKPGAPPFVEVGSVVADDTIIGIIEVMKLMNTVRAGACGTVVEIVATDGALVEYDETLMRVCEETRG